MAKRLYYLDGENLSFKEIKNLKLKAVLLVLCIAVLSSITLSVFNYLSGDVLGFGKARAEKIEKENQILKNQIRLLKSQIVEIESQVNKLLEQDRVLRIAVNLKPINPDIKKVGVGGVKEKYEFNFMDEELEKLLSDALVKLDKLERELKLQQRSYTEIYRKYEENKEMFKHIPAIMPLKGSLTSGFGMRLHPILKVRLMHEGVDILADVGTPVYATGDGVVSYAGRRGRYGKVVEINHGFGYVTLYAHLSKVLVREGQKVKRGDKIALSGATGLVTAPHLHYEVHKNGIPQNPINYFFSEIDPAKYKELVLSKK